MYYPTAVNSDLSQYELIKKRALLLINGIKGEDVGNDLELIENELFSMYKPLKYGGADGYEVNEIKSFERSCIILQQQLNVRPKQMTTLEYFEALNVVKDQIEEQKKIKRKNR